MYIQTVVRMNMHVYTRRHVNTTSTNYHMLVNFQHGSTGFNTIQHISTRFNVSSASFNSPNLNCFVSYRVPKTSFIMFCLKFSGGCNAASFLNSSAWGRINSGCVALLSISCRVHNVIYHIHTATTPNTHPLASSGTHTVADSHANKTHLLPDPHLARCTLVTSLCNAQASRR